MTNTSEQFQPANAGEVYAGLTVKEILPPEGKNGRRCVCACSCGRTAVVRERNLLRGHTRSCGCRRSNAARAMRTKHGHAAPGAKSATYISWNNMRQRCSNPRHPAWPDYGGRGIKVCARWDSFENFLADMGERPEGTSPDRIDNSKGYAPDNCKWATRTQQNRNTRASHKLTYDGQERTIAEWSELTGIPYRTIMSRLRYGWDVAQILEAQSYDQ